MENVPETAFVAIGVISAALISGFWSLISLVIAKDQKVSEFRQAWVNSLRQEISDYLGQLQALSTSWAYFSEGQLGGDHGKKFIKENLERIGKVESQKTRIYLRLNPKEHVDMLTILDDLERMSSSLRSLGGDSFVQGCTKLQVESQRILKCEWERVKMGEKSFRYLRNVSFGVVILAGIAFLFKLYG